MAAMIKRNIFLCVFILMCQCILAQQDAVMLDEVVVADRQLHEFSASQSVLAFNDSIIRNNRPALTALLNYNTPIYFKENGPGMVSSPSFRGTTAQQTTVVWNGLNINSQFNGQTDFNTINTTDFNAIAVRAGGGSVIYGSSAIGGSVHLNSNLAFGKRFENEFTVGFGSFDTFAAHYRMQAASDVVSSQINLSRNTSANDFDLKHSGRQNENGQYYNTSLDFGLGLKIDANNLFRILSYAYDGQRHFSLISPTDSKTKYRDRNARALLEWTNTSGLLSSKVKLAYLGEQYNYFDNVNNPATNFGKAQTLVAKYDGLYTFSSKMALNILADFTQTTAIGSDVAHHKRQIASFAMLYKHRPLEKLEYEIGIRQEVTNNYDSPVLFSAGAEYRFSSFYILKVNGSKNFRIPTFNDLYWGEGGNPNLRPETALQAEIGNVFAYRNWRLTVTAYYIDIKDMIQWLPGTTASWYPINVNAVKSYGLENTLQYHRNSGQHKFDFSGTYAYAVSENKRTGYQLIYVPYHKVTGALAYSWKRFSADIQSLFCGKVFTRSDNDARYNIDAYAVCNFGAAYSFGKQQVAKAGMRVMNLFDENYQVVAGRPFPGRHYNLYLNLKF
jgi:vitamin B12 transporter